MASSGKVFLYQVEIAARGTTVLDHEKWIDGLRLIHGVNDRLEVLRSVQGLSPCLVISLGRGGIDHSLEGLPFGLKYRIIRTLFELARLGLVVVVHLVD